eukprot:TRINITY_DN39559_c0_g1_i1.p1 TRINITY_DN39559_c0_g1~~TRINITY_DN39559_c0_g1_i1.p1  ORF type:complete len:478 (+),score=11.89 TRINITY_DN39559_c0_g1_i1:36-1469(+)
MSSPPRGRAARSALAQERFNRMSADLTDVPTVGRGASPRRRAKREKKRMEASGAQEKNRTNQEKFQVNYLRAVHEGSKGWLFGWLGTSFHRCWTQVAPVVVFAGIVCTIWAVLGRKNEETPWHLGLDMHRILIIPIAFLSVFRTNASFTRFWEARGHVGSATHHCRAIARRVRWVMPQRAMDNFCRLLIGFVAATRWDLHRHFITIPREDAAMFTTLEWEELKASKDCMPVVVLNWLDNVIMEASQRGVLDAYAREGILLHITGLQKAWMGMNKITTTPMPFPYSHLIRVLGFFWLLTAPIVFQSETGYFTPLVIGLFAFTLFGINATGVELELPFGVDLNDLPLYKFQARIEKDVAQFANMELSRLHSVVEELEDREAATYWDTGPPVMLEKTNEDYFDGLWDDSSASSEQAGPPINYSAVYGVHTTPAIHHHHGHDLDMIRSNGPGGQGVIGTTSYLQPSYSALLSTDSSSYNKY